MSQTLSEMSQQKAVGALGTYSHTVPVAGLHRVKVQAYLTPPSGMQIQILQNATVIATTSVSSAMQQSLSLENVLIQAALGDVVNVVLSSSNSNDSAPNNINADIIIARID